MNIFVVYMLPRWSGLFSSFQFKQFQCVLVSFMIDSMLDAIHWMSIISLNSSSLFIELYVSLRCSNRVLIDFQVAHFCNEAHGIREWPRQLSSTSKHYQTQHWLHYSAHRSNIPLKLFVWDEICIESMDGVHTPTRTSVSHENAIELHSTLNGLLSEIGETSQL